MLDSYNNLFIFVNLFPSSDTFRCVVLLLEIFLNPKKFSSKSASTTYMFPFSIYNRSPILYSSFFVLSILISVKTFLFFVHDGVSAALSISCLLIVSMGLSSRISTMRVDTAYSSGKILSPTSSAHALVNSAPM